MDKKFRSQAYISFLLFFSLIQAVTPIVAQQPQRERRVTPAAVATPTPTPVPTINPAEDPQASPTPTPDVVQIRTSATTRTLSELQSRIAQVLSKPELAPAMVGIKVTSLQTGRVLFEENANKLLRPASNMKLYTVAAGLDRLSPDFRFVTSVYAPAKPDGNGVIKGDLTIFGRGDPSIAARFQSGDYFKGIDDLATRIAAAGVKRVDGDLVGDETYFTGPQYGSGWEWEDLQWYYGAEVSALTVNDNALDLFVKPGAQVGAPAVITTGPPDPLLRIVNNVLTGARSTKRELNASRALGGDQLEITGSIALDDKGYTGGFGISRPALLFAYLLRASLSQHGVTVKGKTRTIDARPAAGFVIQPLKSPGVSPGSVRVEIASMQSVPFSAIAAQTLKPSQNLYTEIILRTLGTVVPPAVNTPNIDRTSESDGLEVVKTFLREAGINPSSLVLSDGSGLSRNDMITAEATIQLLTYMHRHRYASVFRDALPIAGVDGTLRNRFKGTPAENNLRAKTGTLSSASSLSGYVRDAAGEELAFSIMVNNYPQDADVRTSCIEPIAVLLASFTGKSQ
ncbi:MAG TPA: D-alanyl-D-alanine carboxypeptidase/D-alanyl-D-alanine-endopeptidase [Pyrinomonadaceae bacterium]|nr:D-alanyl-D-alanine carboxypeptidase/D-alanyl-D-alanine-endopeptidase [Pyrinomonadaceae bacterium]